MQLHRSRKSFVPVTGALADELLACAVLLCQSDVDLRAEGAPLLLCTDASSTREASAVARISEACSVELTRHGLQRGLWCKLLSPLQLIYGREGNSMMKMVSKLIKVTTRILSGRLCADRNSSKSSPP